jgi:hypothetical protein
MYDMTSHANDRPTRTLDLANPLHLALIGLPAIHPPSILDIHEKNNFFFAHVLTCIFFVSGIVGSTDELCCFCTQ